jgi:PAS domain-containing protein
MKPVEETTAGSACAKGSRELPDVCCPEPFLAMFQNSLDAILISGLAGKIVAANPQDLELVEMTEEDEIRKWAQAVVYTELNPQDTI